jgi:hypothetical protein
MQMAFDDVEYLEICVDCYEMMNGILVKNNITPKRNYHKKTDKNLLQPPKATNIRQSKSFSVSSCDTSPVLTMNPVTCRVLRTPFQNYSTPLRSDNCDVDRFQMLSQSNGIKASKSTGFNREYLKLDVESLYKNTPIRN